MFDVDHTGPVDQAACVSERNIPGLVVTDSQGLGGGAFFASLIDPLNIPPKTCFA